MRPYAILTTKSWSGALLKYVARYLKCPKSLELFVPAPIRPRAKIALFDTFLSESYASLFKRSIVAGSGFEILKNPMARGTVLLITGSPY